MKLLLDQNISYRLIERIKSVFSDVYHVKDIGLIDANDYAIFMEARAARFNAIFTLDADFHYLWQQYGAPPKVIWLRVGNCSTAFLADVVLKNHPGIMEFLTNYDIDCLEIFS
jgi:predicted nuclease of predicted toxin-antitoxin system